MDTRQQIDNLLLQRQEELTEEHRPTVFLTCVEAAFLSTAFGPDYLSGDVGQEMFMEAFRVGGPAAQFGVPVA
jgi:hypothetical protein